MESVEAKTKDIMQWHLNLNAFRLKVWKNVRLNTPQHYHWRSSCTGSAHYSAEAVQEDMANEFRDLLVEKFKTAK